jgi:biopolymer transport protein ExbD
MVTASTIAKSSIKVDLPDAATGEATESTSLGLTLKADGTLLLDGEPTSAAGLRNRLKDAKRAGEEVTCLISAEKTVEHGRVVWLIDTVKAEGVTKFAININKVDIIGPDPASVAPIAPVPEGG